MAATSTFRPCSHDDYLREMSNGKGCENYKTPEARDQQMATPTANNSRTAEIG